MRDFLLLNVRGINTINRVFNNNLFQNYKKNTLTTFPIPRQMVKGNMHLHLMKNLNVYKNDKLYSTGLAPHKPILLLAVILSYVNGEMNLRDIKINGYLKRSWKNLWMCLNYQKIGSIYLPMYHLKSEDFWYVTFKKGTDSQKPSSINAIYFTRVVDRIYLDDDLIRLIDNDIERKKLIDSILEGGYFSDKEKEELKNKIGELDKKYSREIKTQGSDDKMKSSYDLSPKKDVYKVAAQDIEPYTAIKELVDNAIDNWKRFDSKDDLNIEIHCDNNSLVVKDNSGGLEEHEIPMLFTLGMTNDRKIKGSIGAFGIGAKKAIVRLGNKATLKSRFKKSDKGFGFEVDEKWLNQNDWNVPKKEFDDMDSGVTKIIIKDLDINWTKNFQNDLMDDLGKTYDMLLRKHKNLHIIVNKRHVKSPKPIDWSFTKFDGLFPRRFKNIKLRNREISEPIYLSITVGLTRSGDPHECGVDFYCQNRKVIENITDKRGGFYPKNKGGLGNFHSHHDKRLKVIVELETGGDASNLPWDTKKSEIKLHHPVTREVHHWMKEIVGPYFAHRTGDIREAAIKPFHMDHPMAANGGEVMEYDYSNVTDGASVKHLPNHELKQIHLVIDKAKRNFLDYYLYGNIDNGSIEEWQKRLYRRELELLENNFKPNTIERRVRHDLYDYIRTGERNKKRLDIHEFEYYKYKLDELKNEVDYENRVKVKARNHLKEYIETGETNPVGLNEVENLIYNEELNRLKKEYEEGNIILNIQSIQTGENKTKIMVEIGGNVRPTKDIPVPIPNDKLNKICEHFGLPPNESLEEIGKEIANLILKEWI